MRISMVFLFLLLFLVNCNSTSATNKPIRSELQQPKGVEVGAERFQQYIPILENKRVALVVNHTSVVGKSHLLDTLLSFQIDIKKVFAPEHGFRGEAGAGTKVDNSVDAKTGIPIISLYGKHKKPTPEELSDVDIVVFDIQDVGVRFYTYISTMSYMMEACAESSLPMIVLDRPNPNGYYVDGPVLEPDFTSFVGLHPVPVVYGMTIGEYATMVNSEGWLKNHQQCDLSVVKCLRYTHDWTEPLPIQPSPNLRTHESILLYPSLCFFEGTVVSVGRGTDTPFQHVGHPEYPEKSYKFVPKSSTITKYPKLENKDCYGLNLQALDDLYLKAENGINLSYIIDFYKKLNLGDDFFLKNNFIDLLAGTDQFRHQLSQGMSKEEIKATWQPKLNEFKEIRNKYLLYP